jgi:hypothetical protein
MRKISSCPYSTKIENFRGLGFPRVPGDGQNLRYDCAMAGNGVNPVDRFSQNLPVSGKMVFSGVSIDQ